MCWVGINADAVHSSRHVKHPTGASIAAYPMYSAVSTQSTWGLLEAHDEGSSHTQRHQYAAMLAPVGCLTCLLLWTASALIPTQHISPRRSVSQLGAARRPRQHAHDATMTGQGKQAYRDVVTPAYTSETDTYVFQYSPPEHRRAVSEARHQNYKGPPMKILLLGKPCSGKGTIAPMLSRAYRAVVVSTGNLLRAEVKAESVLGAIAEEQMAKGKLLPSRLLLSLIQARLTHRDCGANGWILDGFPRSPEQARLLAEAELVPDCIVVLERPDELVREFALGRMQDSATGTIYHPKFNPPPPDAVHRLVWRTDDTPEVIESRLRQHHATMQRTLAEFKGVPTAQIDSARSDLDTFADVCDFVEAVAARKLEALGEEGLRRVSTEVDSRLKDVEVAPEEGEGPDAGTLVAAVRRCNRHDIRHYLPVYMGDSQVGFAKKELVREILTFGGDAAEVKEGYTPLDGPAVVLAPYATSPEERTRTLEGLVQSLVSAGVIDGTSVRDELQDVRPLERMSHLQTPLARMERAAMIHFGVPSHGVHVNGYTAIKVNGGDWWRPHKVWLGVRSMSKATYPGLLDQLAAGGLSSGVSLKENVVRECMEEASVPLSFSKNILPAGQVSYRYSTRKGLSTKILTVFDLQLPEDFVPFNGDGEVEEFRLVPIEEALDSIRHSLHLWKPNCALVMIDFALRHGFVKADDPDYLELCHSLRAGHVPQ
eukprot:TRINITY_DN3302_c0_g2_i1.p1 TRINITY_DN3302_c0_g2~~TRINITY_DN3302_c0_g2_i1.p1  ORF type:complete len:711 (+),score=209.74 TRINITY_DN3302_c0_g2_i1:2723-4855(+)